MQQRQPASDVANVEHGIHQQNQAEAAGLARAIGGTSGLVVARTAPPKYRQQRIDCAPAQGLQAGMAQHRVAGSE